MKLSNKDEGLHVWGSEDNWQESWALAWRDPASGLGGTHRVGIQPNRNTSCLWCGVFFGRDKLYRSNLENVPFVPLSKDVHGFACGSHSMFHDGNDLRVQVNDPECMVDLVVTDFKDSAHTFDDGGGASVVYRNHFNFSCSVNGTVTLKGQKREVKGGLGWRDHSWGPRDWGGVGTHRSFHGNFGPDFCFRTLTFMGRDGTISRRGQLARDGNLIALNDNFTTRAEILEDGMTPVRARCHIFLDDGSKLTFTTNLQKGVLTQTEAHQDWFGIGDLRFEDRDDGFCFFEMTNNPRFGTSDVGIMLGNTLNNGYYEVDTEPWKYELI